MAGYQAIIDVIVNGQSRIDRVIGQTNDLLQAIDSLSRRPIRLQVSDAQRNIDSLASTLRRTDREIDGLQGGLGRTRRSFSTATRQISIYERQLQGVGNELSLVGRRVDELSGRLTRNSPASLFRDYGVAIRRQNELVQQNAVFVERLQRATANRNRQANELASLEERIGNIQQRRRRENYNLGAARGILAQIDLVDNLANSYLRLDSAAARATGQMRNAPAFVPGQVAGVQTNQRSIPPNARFQSVSSIKSEIALFRDLSDSVEINTEAFRKFTIASKAASQSLDDVARRRVQILAEAFSGTTEARRSGTYARPLSGDREVSRTRAEVDRLLAAADAAPRSEAGLSLLIEQLQELRSLIPFVDANYERLTNRISDLNDELQSRGGRARRNYLSTPLGGPEEDAARQSYFAKRDKDLGNQLDKQDALERQIAKSKLNQAQASELIAEINLANNLVVDGELEAARDIAKFTAEKLDAYKILNSQQSKSSDLLNKIAATEQQITRLVDQRESGPRDLSFLDDFNEGLKRTEDQYRQLNKVSVDEGKKFEQQLKRNRDIAQRYASGQFGPQPANVAVSALAGGESTSIDALQTRDRQLKSARIIEKQIVGLGLEGVQTAAEKLRIEALIKKLSDDQLGVSDSILANNARELDNLRSYISLQRQQLSNDKKASSGGGATSGRTLRTGQFSPVDGPRQLRSIIASGRIVEQDLINLRAKGLNVEEELLSIRNSLADASKDDYDISLKNLGALGEQIELARKFVSLKSKIKTGGEAVFGSLGTEFLPVSGKLPPRVVEGRLVQEAAPGSPAASLLESKGAKEAEALQKRLAAQINSTALIAKSLDTLQLKGADTARARADLQEIVVGLTDKELIASDSLLDVSDQRLSSLRNYIREQNKELSNAKIIADGRRGELDSANAIKVAYNDLNTLAANYSIENKKGVEAAQEEASLRSLLSKYSLDQIANTKENAAAIQRTLRDYSSLLRLRRAEAIAAGRYSGGTGGGGKPRSPQQIEDQRNRLLEQANTVYGNILTLEQKNADVAEEKLRIEQQILDLKNGQNKSTQAGLELAASNIRAIRAGVAGAAAALKGISQRAGFDKTINDLKASLTVSRGYFGDKDPAQAIDQIVRAFRGDQPATGDPAKSAAAVGDNVVDTYVSKLRSGASKASKAMFDLGEAGVNAIKKALGIASPSRVMLEIARNQINTYVDFLRASIPAIEAAAKAVGEAGTPGSAGIPESMIRKPLTERRRTAPLTAEDLYNNSVTADFAASLISGPVGSLEAVSLKVEDFINKTRASVDLDKLFADFEESDRVNFARIGRSPGPEFNKLRAALADFYEIPAELTPDLDRSVKAAGDASANADQLQKYVSELVSGLGQIGGLLETAAKLKTAPVRPNDPWGDIAPSSQEASMRYMGQVSFADLASTITDPWENAFEAAAKRAAEVDRVNAQEAQKIAETRATFEPSIQRAAEIDAENARKRISDEFAAARAQVEADAAAAAAAASRTVSEAVADPVGDAVPEGERRVRSAIEKLFDRISGVLGFGGGGQPPSPPRPPGGGAPGAPGDPEDFARRVGQAKTAEALLGLDELRNVRQLSSRELQLLSAAIEEVQQNLRPATADFDRFNNEITQLRGRIGIEQGARDPDADFFARRRIGPRAGRALSEGLVGGAFPLLFGQGLGASVFGGLGGAAGGFAGGGLGFGLSLVGTALGTAFDTTVAAASELGGALNDLSTTFEVVKNRALFSSRETEKLASKLEEAGLVASASILAQEEVIRKIGANGVSDLKSLETASDRLSRAWAEFNLHLQAALAGPMAGLLEWVTSIVAQGNQVRRGYAEINDVRSRLSDKDRKEFDRRAAEIDSLSKLAGINNPNRITREEAITRQVELAREYAPRIRQRPASAAASAEQLLESQLTGAETFVNALNAKLSALDLGKSLIDQVKNATQEQEDLDRQRAKAVEDYERAIGDIRLGVERRITQERLNNLAKENEIYSKQGDIRLQQLKNENAIARESLRGNDLGQQLFDIVAQYSEEQLATENEIANRRRSLEAELQSVAIETEQYKVDVAKQVADLNRSTAEQVQQIQLSTARKQDQSARNRFELEKQIAIAQIKVQELSAKQEARKLETLIKAEQDAGVKADLQASLDIYKGFFEGGGANPFTALENQVKGLKPPAQLSYAGFNVGQGVSTAGYDAVIAKGNELRLRLEELAKALDSLVAAGKFVEVNTLFKNLADQGAAEAANKSKDLKYQFDLLVGAAGAVDPRLKELAKGQAKLLETTAGSKEEFKQLVPLYVQLAEWNIKAADTYQFFNSAIDDNLGQIESLKEEINNLLAGTTEYEKALQSLTQRGLSPASEEAQRLLASAQELDRLKDKIEVINNIRDAATGFTESLRGLVEQFIELRDAGKAVKAFSEDLGKKSLSFVLDLAFKPIEETMQKQFIAFADKLGIDVRPEALKQLTELQQINSNVDSINKKIEPIVSSLAAQQKKAEAEALAKAQQQQALAAQAGAGATAYQQMAGPASKQFGVPVDLLLSRNPALQEYLKGIPADISKNLSGFFTSESIKSQAEKGKEAYVKNLSAAGWKPGEILSLSPLIDDIILRAVQKRLQEVSGFNGQGGPDMSNSMLLAQAIVGDRTPSPLPGESFEGQKLDPNKIIQGVDVPKADGDLPVPGALPQGTPVNPVHVKNVDSGVMPAASAAQSPAANAANEMSAGTQKAASDLEKANGQWLRNLGTTVTALAGAATGVLAIAGGISQVKEGGVYGTLTGLAGIFGGIASITSMFGTGGALSGVFGGGGAPGGSIAPGPVAQSAGVTYSPGYYGPAFRAAGGPVLGGSPYIVGEQGPELFVPDSSGMIISNNDLFSATRDAIASGSIDGDMEDDASDEPGLSSYRSTFSGGQGDQKALQEARDAIQTVNGMAGAAGANGLNGAAGADGQQMLYDANGNPIGMFASTRSAVASASLAAKARANESSLFGANKDALAVAAGGGVAGPLAATRMQVMQQQAAAERNSEMTRIESIVSKPAKMDISYKSQVINNVEYVTAEQAERMSRESAKKGRDLAIGALQASVKARRTAGLI